MGRIRRSPHHVRRGNASRVNSDRERWHWLEEGELGQESLLLDLDPFLYAADATICRLAGAAAYDDPGDPERPFGLLVPPHDAIAWQQAVLSRRYRLAVWGDHEDPISEQAADQFKIHLFSADPPEFLQSACSLVLLTDSQWRSAEHLAETLQELDQYVGAGGRLILLLRTELTPDGVTVLFRDGPLALDRLLELPLFPPFPSTPTAPSEQITLPLHDLSRSGDDYLAAFLKRHRDFFGRSMRDAMLTRLSEQDFTIGDRAGSLAATVLQWSVPAE